MTIGPESFGNGTPKNDDRFATQLGQYRPGGRREAGRAVAGDAAGGDAAARNGMNMIEPRNGTNMIEPRNGSGVLDSRGGSSVLDTAAPIASSIAAPTFTDPTLRDSGALGEPAFAHESWLDGHTGSLADHPLLRGLLMELPPKGAVPQAEYLDRWFEAARSILDLLYAINARP